MEVRTQFQPHKPGTKVLRSSVTPASSEGQGFTDIPASQRLLSKDLQQDARLLCSEFAEIRCYRFQNTCRLGDLLPGKLDIVDARQSRLQ